MANTHFNAVAKDAMLDGVTIDKVSLHSGAPGAGGADNVVAAAAAATFTAAEDNEDGRRKRQIHEDGVSFSGLTPAAEVVNFGLWDDDTYLGYLVRTTGDAAVNAAGEYKVSNTTKIVLGNVT
jgi:hypothetical protein